MPLKSPAPSPPPSSKGLATHAGGVVWRGDEHAGIQILLIRPKSGAQEWVLPKGHIEPGESPPEAALREIREETGVRAVVEGVLPGANFEYNGERIRVACFLLRALHEGSPEEPREHVWRAPSEALALVRHENIARAIRAALARLG